SCSGSREADKGDRVERTLKERNVTEHTREVVEVGIVLGPPASFRQDDELEIGPWRLCLYALGEKTEIRRLQRLLCYDRKARFLAYAFDQRGEICTDIGCHTRLLHQRFRYRGVPPTGR